MTTWIIRVGDGENLRNSKYPYWGVKRSGGIKTVVDKFKDGDLLSFLTSKKHGGKIIGIAKYTHHLDRKDCGITGSYSNKEQNWKGDEDWDIIIHYKNFYDIENYKHFDAVIQCGGTILKYETFKAKDKYKDLPDISFHYTYHNKYITPKKFG